jgi:hypothetical protein
MKTLKLKAILRNATLAAVSLYCVRPAMAEITQCDGGGALGSGAGKISSVPYTITAPGVYCVTAKITANLATGAAIAINSNNVVLDLNDFAIGNLGAGASTNAAGVLAVDRQNVTVRNGIFRGFYAAVALVNGIAVGGTTALSSGHVVSNITADTSYSVGIFVQGPGARIVDNRVFNTIGAAKSNSSSGIAAAQADGAVVRNNSVMNTTCTNGCTTGSLARGIAFSGGTAPVIAENRINNLVAPTATTSIAIDLTQGPGTPAAPTSNALVKGNVMSNWPQGIVFETLADGEYAQNGAIGVTSPYNNGGTNITNGGANF